MFGKKYVGLDIADRTIEIAEVKTTGSKNEVVSLGRVFLEEGVVERGRIIDKNKLAQALKILFAEAKPNPIEPANIIFGLPEAEVFTHIFTTPDEKKIEDAIEQEINQSIPALFKDLIYSYKVLNKKDNELKIFVIACLKEVLQEWRDFFSEQGIDVEIFDTEVLASFRDIFFEPPTSPVCLVDIGSATTRVGIFDSNGLCMSYFSGHAGDLFDIVIAEKLGISAEIAQQKKKELGFLLGNEIYESLADPLTDLVKSIKQNLQFFEAQSLKKVEKIILLGGSSLMKGLAEFFGEQFALPVEVASAKSIKGELPLEYLGAVGLALYGLEKKWQKSDPVFDMQEIKLSNPKPNPQISLPDEEKEKDGSIMVAQPKNHHKISVDVLIFLTLLLVAGAIAWWYFVIMR
ncbi:MAG: pilus assembly protein PilM [Candidatus Magasanikbacteria bacterium]